MNGTRPVIRDSTVRKVDNEDLFAERLPGAPGSVGTWKQCAYNQTKGCFLGLDIDAGDFAVASLDDRMPALTPKSGAGLWLVPFKGISASSVHIPLDLVYLDPNCTVIDVVESFPIFSVSLSSPPAASVLVLPARMITSTETQPGDQLILCTPEEMKWRLQRLPRASGAAPAVQSAAPRKEEPIRGGPPNLLQWEDRSKLQRPDENRPNEDLPLSQESIGKAVIEPGMKNIKPLKSWWQRLLSPGPPNLRKAPRELLPGLAAYFWTGGAPEQHGIRDISSTGLYVVTEERWYPGTVVRMRLTDTREPTVERSISVNACAVRWGNDGVGLEFVLQDAKNLRPGQTPLIDGVDKKQLDQFLQRLRSGKG